MRMYDHCSEKTDFAAETAVQFAAKSSYIPVIYGKSLWQSNLGVLPSDPVFISWFLLLY